MNIVDQAEKAWADNAIEVKQMEYKLRKITGSKHREQDLLIASIRSFWIIQWIRKHYEKNEQTNQTTTGLVRPTGHRKSKKGRGRTTVTSSVDA